MNQKQTGSKPQPGEVRKAIDLEERIIEALQIQAIKTGNRNFKQYAELVLRAQASKDMVQVLEELAK